MTRIYNRRDMTTIRRQNRSEMPPAEAILWSRIRRCAIGGARFRRQYSVGGYVVDFYCPALRLVIELDGDTHFGGGAEERDAVRDAYIQTFGIQVIRFTNDDVYQRLEPVLERIAAIVSALGVGSKLTPPRPSPC